MTDRDAIRRLAATVARYAERNREGQLRSEVMELLDAISEPAAPTPLTREQAEIMARVLHAWIHQQAGNLWLHDLPLEREMPAVFRAVADRLEGE